MLSVAVNYNGRNMTHSDTCMQIALSIASNRSCGNVLCADSYASKVTMLHYKCNLSYSISRGSYSLDASLLLSNPYVSSFLCFCALIFFFYAFVCVVSQVILAPNQSLYVVGHSYNAMLKTFICTLAHLCISLKAIILFYF